MMPLDPNLTPVAPITGYGLYLVRKYGDATSGPPPRDTRCLAPDPDMPTRLCQLTSAARGHDHRHTWWYCPEELNEVGDAFALQCELQRGHAGNHRVEW